MQLTSSTPGMGIDHAPQIERALVGVGRVGLGAEHRYRVGADVDGNVGEQLVVRAVEEVVLGEALVVVVAPRWAELTLGRHQIQPTLRRLGLIVRVLVGIDVPLAELGVERMGFALGHAISQRRLDAAA